MPISDRVLAMVLTQYKNVSLMSAISQFSQNCIACTWCINKMEKHQLHICLTQMQWD